MPESPIRKLAPLAYAAKEKGIHVYHLNIGQPDLPTPKAAIDAIKNIDRSILEYSPSQGYLSYRKKLVGYYSKYNINPIAVKYGGGGHAKASGATVADKETAMAMLRAFGIPPRGRPSSGHYSCSRIFMIMSTHVGILIFPVSKQIV